jgi:signal transduction histidine kinase
MAKTREGAGAEQAANARSAHSDALAATAHDFCNMLQCATSALRVSRRELRELGQEKLESLIFDAESALERATVLAWRLAGVDKRHPSPKAVSVPQTILEMRTLLARAAGERVQLEIATADRLPLVLCDVRDLENALLNLVVNAREAMPHGGRIAIAIGAVEGVAQAAATGVLISVADNGCGMGAATADKAFDRSFSTKGAGAFRGLGLASVRRFVCGLGGSVDLESRVGRGTSVHLTLPGACSSRRGLAEARALQTSVEAGSPERMHEDD